MGLVVRDKGGDFEMAPAGNHIAVCYMVIDLGDQPVTFQGDTKIKPQLRLSWELSSELMSDGRPFSVSKKYTASLDKKSNLRRDLESWRGRAFTEAELEGFDVRNVLGKACMVNVIHEPGEAGKTYVKVSGVASMPKGMQAPDLSNQPLSFSLDDPDAAQKYAAMPDWLKKLINTEKARESSHDLPPLDDYESGGGAFEDDIPFAPVNSITG